MNASASAERPRETRTAADGGHTASARPGDAAADAVRAAGELAGDVGRLGAAWLELARAEMTVARLSAFRLALGSVALLVLGFGVWLFANLALVYWLGAILMRMDVASILVAGINLAGIIALVLGMRRWWRAMHMPRSRAALGEIARTLS